MLNMPDNPDLISALYIEDDGALREIYRRFIEDDGDIIVATARKEEAAEILDTFQFDVILSEYHLSDRKGTSILLHQKERNDKTPCIILSSQNDADTILRAYKQGAADYIRKSEDPASIAVIIKNRIRDAALKKRREKDLERYRLLLQSTLDAIPDIIGIQTPDHKIVYYNQAGYSFLNLKPEEVRGRHCFELIGRNRQCDICATEKALRSKKLERVEKYLPEKEIYLDCRSYPVLDDEGEVIFIVEQLSDITERKRSEEETRSLATEYETVFNGTQDCIFLIRVADDGKFRFIRNNLAHENATGLTTEMLHEKTPEELLGEEAGSVVSANYQRCIDTKGPNIYEETLNLPAGERTWETLLTPVIRDERITHIVGSSRDITNQKLIEMELRLSEERYRDFFDNANVMIQSVDDKGHFIFVNRTWKEKMGFSDEEIENLSLFEIIHPDSLEHCQSLFQDVLSGKTVSGVQATFLTKDRRPIHIEGNVNSFVQDGKWKTRGIFQDITGRRIAEEAVRIVNTKLQLLSSITRHDILNEVMVLLGNLEFAEEKSDDPEVGKYLEKVKEAGRTIQRHIEFTRLYENLGISEPEWQKLAALIPKSKDPVTITNNCTSISIFGDPMLERVFSNLLDNTIRHGEHATTVTIDCYPVDEGLHIIWRDNGAGVAHDQKEVIFKRGVGKNTGFGLFLSREILAITGMFMRETGIPGEGAQFEILIPKEAYTFN